VLATELVNRDTANAGLTVGVLRHRIEKMANDLLLACAMQDASGDTTRQIGGLQTALRPSARQRFVEQIFVDGGGKLLAAEQKRLERDLDGARHADLRAQFEAQRAIVNRGSDALANRRKLRL
jgi:hypothetical protein